MDASRRSDESRLNRAFGWFAFLGLATLPVDVAYLLSVMHWVKESDLLGWAELFGFSLAGPLLAGMAWASIYGIRQTVRFRHPALIALSAISIVFAIVFVGAFIAELEYQDLPIVDDGLTVAFGIYIAGNILIPAWWFTRGRRQYRARDQAQH